MKFLILLCVAVLGVSASVVKSSSRANLNAGNINSGDVLLHSTYVYREAQSNSMQTEDVSFVGNSSSVITAVQAQEVGTSQYASASIISGGIRQSWVTVRFRSSYGRGYYFLLNVWGSA